MNSGYERECKVEGCRVVRVMKRPRGEGGSKNFLLKELKNFK